LLAVPAFGQPAAPASPPDPLGAREVAALQRSAEWEALARGLEGKIARMLPCDQRVRGAIEEVSRASQARMASVLDYLQAAAAQSRVDAEQARAAAGDMDNAAKEANVERTEAEQQRTAVDAQIADLKESVASRPSLDNAAVKLSEIGAMTVARAERWQQDAGRRAELGGGLADLASASEARQKAIDGEIAALAEEAARWVDYYTARLSRAAMECSVTKQGRPSQRKKP
jgi:hypothetical protein